MAKRDLRAKAQRNVANAQARAKAAPKLMEDKRQRLALNERLERTRALMTGQPPGTKSFVAIDSILPRLHDTRPVNEKRVEQLVESYLAVGLLEPIGLDKQKRLLFGKHRWEAAKRLRGRDPEAFDRWFPNGEIEVSYKDVDAEKESERAFQIEVIENEHRHDYSKEEVGGIIERLKAAGYRDQAGRPKDGEKSLRAMLQVITGKSQRQAFRFLAEYKEGEGDAAATRQTRPRPLTKTIRTLSRFREHLPEDVLAAFDAFLGQLEMRAALEQQKLPPSPLMPSPQSIGEAE